VSVAAFPHERCDPVLMRSSRPAGRLCRCADEAMPSGGQRGTAAATRASSSSRRSTPCSREQGRSPGCAAGRHRPRRLCAGPATALATAWRSGLHRQPRRARCAPRARRRLARSLSGQRRLNRRRVGSSTSSGSSVCSSDARPRSPPRPPVCQRPPPRVLPPALMFILFSRVLRWSARGAARSGYRPALGSSPGVCARRGPAGGHQARRRPERR
jgi:hypothetical protein